MMNKIESIVKMEAMEFKFSMQIRLLLSKSKCHLSHQLNAYGYIGLNFITTSYALKTYKSKFAYHKKSTSRLHAILLYTKIIYASTHSKSYLMR